MTLTPDQVLAANKANLETLAGLTSKAFAGMEQLIELNMSAAKAALSDAQHQTESLMSVRDAQELMSLQAQMFQPLAEKAAAYNRQVFDIAQSTGSPLWNYWLALQDPSVINQGISADGVHPSIYMNELGADFTTTGLRYGYNQRNLTAVQVLEAIKRIVIDDGAPDS